MYVNTRAPVRSINDMALFNQQHRISQVDGTCTEYPIWGIPYESQLSAHHDSVASTEHRSTQRGIIVHMSGKDHYMSTLWLRPLVLVSEYTRIKIIMFADALAPCITTTCNWLCGKIPLFSSMKKNFTICANLYWKIIEMQLRSHVCLNKFSTSVSITLNIF